MGPPIEGFWVPKTCFKCGLPLERKLILLEETNRVNAIYRGKLTLQPEYPCRRGRGWRIAGRGILILNNPPQGVCMNKISWGAQKHMHALSRTCLHAWVQAAYSGTSYIWALVDVASSSPVYMCVCVFFVHSLLLHALTRLWGVCLQQPAG
jgi:hypothetical protein